MKRKILIVDDQTVNRRKLRGILGDVYEIVEAESGLQALDIMCREAQSISVVLLDIVMPGLDGYGVLRAMEKDEELSKIPVLVMTSKESEADELKALELGAFDYLSKPCRSEIIRHRIAKTIRLQESTARLSHAEHLANTDALTGLNNRTALEVCVNDYFHDNPGGAASMLMLDLDHFKDVNDMHGHTDGDRLLREISMVLKSCFRDEDVLARVGGDEFAAFLPSELSKKQLESRMSMICTRVAVFDEEYHVTCSVGACSSPQDGQNFETLYKNADIALLTAKRLGKNRCQLFGGEAMPTPEIDRSMDWLLDEIPEGLLITDEETHEILYMNKAACRIAGKRRSECLYKPCYKALLNIEQACEVCSAAMEDGDALANHIIHSPNGNEYKVTARLFQWKGRQCRLFHVTTEKAMATT